MSLAQSAAPLVRPREQGAAALAFRLALRDLRGGVRGLRIVLACLALGVGAIAIVGSLRASMDRGLATEGRRLLGGDVAIESGAEPLPEALAPWIAAYGGRVSRTAKFRSLLVAESGTRMLVEVKAVDAAYPLIGQASLSAGTLDDDLGAGLVADPLIFERLGVRAGDPVRLGASHLPLVAALAREPDRTGGPGLLGPRVMMAQAAVPATGLIQPGSLVTYEWRVLLPAGADAGRFVADLNAAFPATGWRIRQSTQADPGIADAVAETSTFFVLVGLSALLVGGIGVATGVRAWLEGRAATIATLRCLGASGRMVFAIFLIQILGLCAVGIAAGVAAGAVVPVAVLAEYGNALPVPTTTGLYPAPLALAALYGLLTACAFALWPLGRAVRIPGAALFRDALLPVGGPGRAVVAANVGAGLLLVGVVVASSADRALALWFCGSAVATLALFRAGASGIMALARRIRVARPVSLRLGVANLYRPAAATPLLVCSLGLGLATLSAVALIEANIQIGLATALPADAPSFFFIDIQNDQLDRFEQIAAGWPGAAGLREVPSLRARIVSLKGVPVDQVTVAPGSQWALRGDRGLTYAADIPKGSRVVQGDWWPGDYAGPPLLSLDRDLARGWGLAPGDALVANVLGRDIAFRVANLRAIDWRAFTLNFTMVASPGLLERAPHMHIATIRTAAPTNDAPLLRAVTDALPNVTGIRVADVIASLGEIVGKLGTALAAAGGLTLAAGALVLAGTIAAGQRRRTADAVVLKTLGGTAAQIRAAWLVEFGLIGAGAGAIAAGLGTAASWAVMHFVLHAPWSFLPGVLAAVVGGCVALMLACGYVSTATALRSRVAPMLRN